jgi:hypothetical protein
MRTGMAGVAWLTAVAGLFAALLADVAGLINPPGAAWLVAVAALVLLGRFVRPRPGRDLRDGAG